MKKISKLLSLALVLSLLFSCKKNDNGMPSNTDGKNLKFTITANGVEDQDYVSFVIVGATADNAKTIWKVNGVTMNNETTISLGKNDFMGATKTYVIESTTPLMLVTTSQQCLNPGASNPSYKVSFKAELNGKVVTNDQDFTVTSTTDYTHKYDY